MTDLTDMEMEVLRICGGEDVPGWTWGAGMGACLEALRGRSLVTRGTIAKPTERGQKLLDEYYAAQGEDR